MAEGKGIEPLPHISADTISNRTRQTDIRLPSIRNAMDMIHTLLRATCFRNKVHTPMNLRSKMAEKIGFKNQKSNPILINIYMTIYTLICCQCKHKFTRTAKDMSTFKKRKIKNMFCSHKCQGVFKTLNSHITASCQTCNKQFLKKKSECKKTKNHFCSSSCAAIYNNAHKTTGTRRSKLEIWLEQQLKSLYPNLEIHFNKKEAINSELDIYIPSLKLAFELNGIFHYEPIFGSEKLLQIQNNDQRKFQACLESKIELCIIDSSKFTYFKKSKAIEFLNIIANLITTKLEESKGIGPLPLLHGQI